MNDFVRVDWKEKENGKLVTKSKWVSIDQLGITYGNPAIIEQIKMVCDGIESGHIFMNADGNISVIMDSIPNEPEVLPPLLQEEFKYPPSPLDVLLSDWKTEHQKRVAAWDEPIQERHDYMASICYTPKKPSFLSRLFNWLTNGG